ncbi:hypothetical protein [Streptomyces sp. NPDC050485]|uniref:hypothetical protein n=1 Tax=Streptomyces sp. NPDC050485 TaxID=3365617 RepID=UPI0037AB620A
MRIRSIAAALVLAGVVSAASVSGAQAADQLLLANNCGCPKGDVTCLAKCFGLPDPTEDQSSKTSDCVNAAIENGGGDSVFSNCRSFVEGLSFSWLDCGTV